MVGLTEREMPYKEFKGDKRDSESMQKAIGK